MTIRRLAAVFGLLLVLAAAVAVHGLRHGSFAAAAGIDPLAADSVRVSGADGAVRVISSRDAVLELVACLSTATYTRQADGQEPETGGVTLVFLRRGRPMASLRLGRMLTVDGCTYAVRGLDAARLHTLTELP